MDSELYGSGEGIILVLLLLHSIFSVRSTNAFDYSRFPLLWRTDASGGFFFFEIRKTVDPQ